MFCCHLGPKLAWLLTPPAVCRLSLESSCTALRHASQRWFPEVDVCLWVPDPAAAEGLAAWLRRHDCKSCCRATAAIALRSKTAGCHHLSTPCFRCPGDDTWAAQPTCCCLVLSAAGQAHITLADAGGSDRVNDAGMIASLCPLRGARVTSILAKNNVVTPVVALEGLGALTGVQFTSEYLSGDVRLLCQLAQLRHVALEGTRMTGSWRQLAALTRLEHLALSDIAVQEVVDVLPALVALTRLELCGFEHPVSSWHNLRQMTQLQHLSLATRSVREALQHLQALPLLEHLQVMPFAVLPPELSALTNLTCLDLSDNNELSAGWQHLLPLARLGRLDLTSCNVYRVPLELTALTGLTSVLL